MKDAVLDAKSLTKVKIPLDWTQEMAAYLRAIDPYLHLITTSYATAGQPETWSLPTNGRKILIMTPSPTLPL